MKGDRWPSVVTAVAGLWRASPYVAPNLADSGGAMEGFRGSGVKGLGVKEEEWKVQGGRLKRGLSLFHWASGLKVTG